MADIRPFAGIRPQKGKAAEIAALPYDVYSRKEASEYAAGHPTSFLCIDRAETQFPDTMDMYDEKVYQKAHDMLWGMVEDGSFIRDEKKCYYLYELTMNGRTQTGIVACASIDDYLSGVIKKHENTRAEKEADRIRHVDVCDAQTGAIFLAYHANEVIRELVAQMKQQEAEYDFTSEDGIRHRVFVITEENTVLALSEAFAQMGQIYIADGHHRAASAVKVGLKRREENPGYTGKEEFNYFLSVLFPDEELMIMDYNRAVKDLNGYTAETFLQEVEKRFCVKVIDAASKEADRETALQAFKPAKRGTFAMYLNNTWYQCEIKDSDRNPQNPVEDLDVSILQNILLEPVLGIKDPKTDNRIDFIGGIRGMKELEMRCHTDCAVAFAMYPTSIGELFSVADAGLLMPPKSTWFEPKLRSGLFIHALGEHV